MIVVSCMALVEQLDDSYSSQEMIDTSCGAG